MDSIDARVNIAGIGAVRQIREPTRYLGLAAQVAKFLTIVERTIETRITERRTTRDAGLCHIALDGGELERQSFHRLRQFGQNLCLEAFDVDLDEGRAAMRCDKSIERGHR